jgi:hypothetical protein
MQHYVYIGIQLSDKNAMEIKKQMQLSCLVIGHKREIFAISQL